MKRLILVLLIVSSFLKAYCQKDSTQIKLINAKVSAMESALLIQPKACVDSSKNSHEPFKELYYKNILVGELGKVDKIIFNPDVRITYYFTNNLLIKVIAIDKSTNITFTIESFFQGDKLLYSSHKNIDGDISGKWLIKYAKEYIERYGLIMKHD